MGSSLPYLYSLGTFKIVVTLIKYVPQAVLNYRRQSTVGWTIHNVLLDFTGGVCSVAQLFIDAGSWALVVSNFPKLGLGLISMFFDCIFFFQHYCLYNRAAGSTELLVEETDEKSRIILPESINV
jgi:cystinosin